MKKDECLVITDWKMKILACFFRESQAMFFGKRGTSLLGFMLVANRPGSEDEKDVMFIFLVTDDTKQDDYAVICGKKYIYTEARARPFLNF